MPAQRLTQPPNPLYKLTLVVTHHAYDLFPTVGVRVDLEFVDGLKATVAHWEATDDEVADLPGVIRDLTDGFLWGDGAKGVITQVQAHDRSRQSRKVRESLPPG